MKDDEIIFTEKDPDAPIESCKRRTYSGPTKKCKIVDSFKIQGFIDASNNSIGIAELMDKFLEWVESNNWQFFGDLELPVVNKKDLKKDLWDIPTSIEPIKKNETIMSLCFGGDGKFPQKKLIYNRGINFKRLNPARINRKMYKKLRRLRRNAARGN